MSPTVTVVLPTPDDVPDIMNAAKALLVLEGGEEDDCDDIDTDDADGLRVMVEDGGGFFMLVGWFFGWIVLLQLLCSQYPLGMVHPVTIAIDTPSSMLFADGCTGTYYPNFHVTCNK
jgi:hypothetical protein